MSNEEIYSYKTSSSQLVKIAEIASRYKDEGGNSDPEDRDSIFRISSSSDRKRDGDPTDAGVQLYNLLCDAFCEAERKIYHPHVQKCTLSYKRCKRDRHCTGRSPGNKDGRDNRR